MISFTSNVKKKKTQQRNCKMNCSSDARNTFLLRKVIKNHSQLMSIMESPFTNDTCVSMYLKECSLAWPRGRRFSSMLPKVPSISVSQEHMKRPLKIPKRLWSTPCLLKGFSQALCSVLKSHTFLAECSINYRLQKAMEQVSALTDYAYYYVRWIRNAFQPWREQESERSN